MWKRVQAVDGSIALYNMICAVVQKVSTPGPTPFVVPGGVKKFARMVYKTVTKYGCNFVK